MKSAPSTNTNAKIKALEAKVLKATMRRYAEHRRIYGEWNGDGHTKTTCAMVNACRKLYEAKHGK